MVGKGLGIEVGGKVDVLKRGGRVKAGEKGKD